MEKKPKIQQQQKVKKASGKPQRKFVKDPHGQLGLAKSIAARFGEEIFEEEFFENAPSNNQK